MGDAVSEIVTRNDARRVATNDNTLTSSSWKNDTILILCIHETNSVCTKMVSQLVQLIIMQSVSVYLCSMVAITLCCFYYGNEKGRMCRLDGIVNGGGGGIT